MIAKGNHHAPVDDDAEGVDLAAWYPMIAFDSDGDDDEIDFCE